MFLFNAGRGQPTTLWWPVFKLDFNLESHYWNILGKLWKLLGTLESSYFPQSTQTASWLSKLDQPIDITCTYSPASVNCTHVLLWHVSRGCKHGISVFKPLPSPNTKIRSWLQQVLKILVVCSDHVTGLGWIIWVAWPLQCLTHHHIQLLLLFVIRDLHETRTNISCNNFFPVSSMSLMLL